jgi:hypothetical protein
MRLPEHKKQPLLLVAHDERKKGRTGTKGSPR